MENPAPIRKRSLTSMTLNWIADRMRKAAKIKEEINSGTYKVDPQQVAEAMVSSNRSEKSS